MEAALKRWRRPDAGIWEVCGDRKHFTSPQIMCWVAVERGVRLASMIRQESRAAEWQLAPDEFNEDIGDGYDEVLRMCGHPPLLAHRPPEELADPLRI